MLVPHFKFNNLHSVGFFTFTKKYQKTIFESFLKMCDDFEHVFNYLMDSKLICDCCIRLMLWKNWIQSKPVPLIFMVFGIKARKIRSRVACQRGYLRPFDLDTS